MSIFTPCKTSAKLIVQFAEEEWGINSPDCSPQTRKKYLLLYDIFIKARSYAILNKVLFYVSILFGIAIVFWPSIDLILEDLGHELKFFESAVVQTSITGIGLICFLMYSHYKKRQMIVENLMRLLVHSDFDQKETVAMVISAMEKIDTGFTFNEATGQTKQTDKSQPAEGQ